MHKYTKQQQKQQTDTVSVLCAFGFGAFFGQVLGDTKSKKTTIHVEFRKLLSACVNSWMHFTKNMPIEHFGGMEHLGFRAQLASGLLRQRNGQHSGVLGYRTTAASHCVAGTPGLEWPQRDSCQPHERRAGEGSSDCADGKVPQFCGCSCV